MLFSIVFLLFTLIFFANYNFYGTVFLRKEYAVVVQRGFAYTKREGTTLKFASSFRVSLIPTWLMLSVDGYAAREGSGEILVNILV